MMNAFMFFSFILKVYAVRIIREPLYATWDWRDVAPVGNYLTPIRNQHNPRYCGSCWAFATSSAISDRLNIVKNNNNVSTVLSPQYLLDCISAYDGCDGGDSYSVYKHAIKKGLVSESCSPYKAVTAKSCISCYTCSEDGSCADVKKYERVFISSVTQLPQNDVDKIKREIQSRGPIVCSTCVSDAFEKEYTSTMPPRNVN